MLKRLLKIIASTPAITSFWNEGHGNKVGVRTYDIGSDTQIRFWSSIMRVYFETVDLGFIEGDDVWTIHEAIKSREKQLQKNKVTKFLTD